MADPAVAAAKSAERLNGLFPILAPGDAAAAAAATADPAPDADASTHHAAWDRLWRDASFLPWDRNAPNPALHDALAERQDLLGNALHGPDDGTAPAAGDAAAASGGTSTQIQPRRRTALVPGCGRGYDVFLLRAFGYAATGLDVSAAAVAASQVVAQQIEAGQGPGDGLVEGVGYGAVDAQIGLGTAKVVEADFFTLPSDGAWDLIFDYTFLSAIPPSLRPRWAATYARLLAPGGRLVCCEFPTTKPTDSGGPPWGLPEAVYRAHLQHPGVIHPYDGAGNVQFDAAAPPSSGGLECLARWSPRRSHPASAGTDIISVWRRVGA